MLNNVHFYFFFMYNFQKHDAITKRGIRIHSPDSLPHGP